MKKILFLLPMLFICMLITSLGVHAKSKYEPECKISGFDNAEICTVRTYGVYVYNKNTVLSSVAFGGLWVNSNPDFISLTINLGDIMTNIDRVSFNVDGKIDTFKVDLQQNKVSRNGSLANTFSAVIVPVEYLEKLVNSKDIKYRVSTVSDGYREGSFYSPKGVASEPIETLKNLLEKAKQR